MPRFYFHVYDDLVALDDEGAELPSVAEAREAAVRAARELATEEIKRKGTLTMKHRIEVEDERPQASPDDAVSSSFQDRRRLTALSGCPCFSSDAPPLGARPGAPLCPS